MEKMKSTMAIFLRKIHKLPLRLKILSATLAFLIVFLIGLIYFVDKRSEFTIQAAGVPTRLTATLVGAADDVLYDYWAYKWIAAALDGSLINMCNADYYDENYLGDYLFSPETEISKIEAIVMMARAKKIELAESYTQSFSDVLPVSTGNKRTDDIFRYVEAAYRQGLLEGYYQTNPDGSKTLDKLGLLSINDFAALLVKFGLAANNTVQYPDGFPSVDRTTTKTNRAQASALVVHNANLAGANFDTDQPKGVYMEWEFPPEGDLSGYDWGFLVYRKDSAETDYQLLFDMEPQEFGTEEGSGDIGMYADDTVVAGHIYTYQVYLINRDGEYSASPAETTITAK